VKEKPLLHCHVLLTGVLPGLIPPSLRLPGLGRLLALTVRAQTQDEGAEAWLCRRFGVAPKPDWPVAAFSALADGLPVAEGDAWLRIDPAHLQLLRDRLVVTDSHPMHLSEPEAAALLEILNRHFADDGLEFLAPVPQRWYLRLTDIPSFTTTALHAAVGLDVDRHLPQGEAALLWHQRINEAQMLLHDHPVNLAREERGEPVINSVWPWGAGRLSPVPSDVFDTVTADDPLARGLATYAEIPLQPIPSSFAEWLDAASGNALIVLDALDAPTLRQSHTSWLTRLQQIDSDWFQPLHDSLRAGGVKRISLHMADFGRVRSFNLNRARRWQFWLRPQPLETYLHG
jgi:hypothetical protein